MVYEAVWPWEVQENTNLGLLAAGSREGPMDSIVTIACLNHGGKSDCLPFLAILQATT